MERFCPLCENDSVSELFRRADPQYGLRVYADCPVCGMVFLDRQALLTPTQEKERYDLHQNGPEDAGYLKFLSRLADPLKARLRPGSRGLDFGCGPGPAMNFLFREGGWRLEKYDPIYFNDKNVLSVQYDFITCTEVVEHLRSPRKTFDELESLLNPRGILAVMTQLVKDSVPFSEWWYQKDPTHVCFYRPKTFEWIAARKKWRLEFPAPDVIFLTKQN